MTLRDGDPRTFDREIYSRLTRPERWAATRRYIIRIGPGYRNHRRYRDDEPAASVARHSILYGLFVLGCCLAGFSAGVLPVILSLAAAVGPRPSQSVDTTAMLIVGWVGAVVTLVLTGLRARQINRWFAERYPTLDERLFWRLLRKS